MGTLLNALPALQGFFTIGVLIGVGWLLAHVRVLNGEHRKMMSLVALSVASPALMFVTMSQADLHKVFSHSVIAAYGAILFAGAAYVIVSRVWFRHNLAGTTIGAMLSCYSNAGNLGIPVAAYALGDVTWVVPILLVQLVVLQPFVLGVFDHNRARESGNRASVLSLVTLPVRNPLTVGTLAGLAVAVIRLRWAGFHIPDFVFHPVQMLGDVAVPMMLLAFGVSLRLDPRPDSVAERVESRVVIAAKVLVQPVVAFVLAAFVLHLDPVTVRAVTVVACLPPAQNLFVLASRYDVRMDFTRDVVFRATAVSVIVILLAATVLA